MSPNIKKQLEIGMKSNHQQQTVKTMSIFYQVTIRTIEMRRNMEKNRHEHRRICE